MKIKTSIIVLLVIAALILAAGVAYAQTTGYSLSWWSVDGGGGASTGSGIQLQGTIGQPDAGQMTGEGYILSGGFWGPQKGEVSTGYQLFLPLVQR